MGQGEKKGASVTGKENFQEIGNIQLPEYNDAGTKGYFIFD